MRSFDVDSPEQYRYIHIIALSVVVVFPTCLLRNVAILRYAMILSIASISYTTIVLIIEMPMYWINAKNSGNLVFFKFDWSFLSAFGITFFAFMSQTSFYSATETLGKRDVPHLTKASHLISIF